MDVRGLKRDVRRGAVSLEQLLEAVEKLARDVRRLEAENSRLRQRLARYEPDVLQESSGEDESSEQPERSVRYSVADEERRRGKKGPAPKRRGRVSTAEKLKDAQRIDDLYPDGARPQDCEEVTQRVVWRIENGQAVRVGYRIHSASDGTTAEVLGVLPRGEFDVEIVLAVAYLTYILRISLDQVCFLGAVLLEVAAVEVAGGRLAQPVIAGVGIRIRTAVLSGWRSPRWSARTRPAGRWGRRPVTSPCSPRPPKRCCCSTVPRACRHCRDCCRRRSSTACSSATTMPAIKGSRAHRSALAHLLRKAIKLTLLYPQNTTYREFLDFPAGDLPRGRSSPGRQTTGENRPRASAGGRGRFSRGL